MLSRNNRFLMFKRSQRVDLNIMIKKKTTTPMVMRKTEKKRRVMTRT